MASSNRASPERALSFARALVIELKRRRPDARGLEAREGAEIGLREDDEWVPVLKLAGGSKACNVMWLLVAGSHGWVPTGLRGTPAVLAEKLAAAYAYLWKIEVTASGFSPTG